MADEIPEPEASTEEYQPPLSVVVLYGRDGREHHTSPTSKFAVDGLADGTLTEQPPEQILAEGGAQNTEEAPNGGSEPGSDGDDPKPGDIDGGEGPGDGAADTAGSGRRRRTGQA